jgi:hypothetical protein
MYTFPNEKFELRVSHERVTIRNTIIIIKNASICATCEAPENDAWVWVHIAYIAVAVCSFKAKWMNAEMTRTDERKKEMRG